MIYHTAEPSLEHSEKQIQLPVRVVNCGKSLSIALAKQALDPRPCLMSNFDPILLRDGSPEQVAKATEELMAQSLPGGRYIFNTGEGAMCNSPPANVAAMLDAARVFASRAGQLIKRPRAEE